MYLAKSPEDWCQGSSQCISWVKKDPLTTCRIKPKKQRKNCEDWCDGNSLCLKSCNDKMKAKYRAQEEKQAMRNLY